MKQTIKTRLSVVPFVFLPTTRAIMQGQEPDELSLAALRTTLAAASQWAFAQSIFLTTANWSEQEKFLGLQKSQEISVCVHIAHFAANYLFAIAKY